MIEVLAAPWPWYVAGPLLGLVVPLLLLVGGKTFGVSSNLRHLCAATVPGKADFFRYDWKGAGLWNLTFIAGTVLGGVLAATLLAGGDPAIDLAAATVQDLRALGVTDFTGLVPSGLISFGALTTPAGFLAVVGGGFLVGFGARYAGGCTSGHAISGLAAFEGASLIAVLGFFAGGLFVTYVVLPFLL
jgi:uncharacterized membrane protein YedE/YeeE